MLVHECLVADLNTRPATFFVFLANCSLLEQLSNMSFIWIAYGYRRRSAKLMTFLKQGMERYGLVSFLRGNQRCDIEEIRLDDMISFRVKSKRGNQSLSKS